MYRLSDSNNSTNYVLSHLPVGLPEEKQALALKEELSIKKETSDLKAIGDNFCKQLTRKYAKAFSGPSIHSKYVFETTENSIRLLVKSPFAGDARGHADKIRDDYNFKAEKEGRSGSYTVIISSHEAARIPTDNESTVIQLTDGVLSDTQMYMLLRTDHEGKQFLVVGNGKGEETIMHLPIEAMINEYLNLLKCKSTLEIFECVSKNKINSELAAKIAEKIQPLLLPSHGSINVPSLRSSVLNKT
jgi:hypothetical protein